MFDKFNEQFLFKYFINRVNKELKILVIEPKYYSRNLYTMCKIKYIYIKQFFFIDT